MSSPELQVPPLIGYVRNTRRRKMALDVDLNVEPPTVNQDQEGTSGRASSQEVQTHQQRAIEQSTPIDVEAFDDDVVISSAGAFAEAKNNSRRNRGRIMVVDVDSEERSSRFMNNNHNKRRRVSGNQTIINCDLYINLEGSSNSMKVAAPPPPQPVPKEATFNCPVCMGPLVEEMSTKCGHIFCKACIKTAIAAQHKCPTCRRKLTMRDTIRIYLPAAS